MGECFLSLQITIKTSQINLLLCIIKQQYPPSPLHYTYTRHVARISIKYSTNTAYYIEFNSTKTSKKTHQKAPNFHSEPFIIISNLTEDYSASTTS